MSEDWWETATEWVCTECGTTNPMSRDVCSGCDCSLDGFVDDSWLYQLEEEQEENPKNEATFRHGKRD